MDWETEKKIRTKRFWLGAFTGFAAAVFLFAGVWSVWQLGGMLAGGNYASGSVTETDVEKKLDKINRLIESYYLYEDEIDADALIEGMYSGYAAALGDPYTAYYD